MNAMLTQWSPRKYSLCTYYKALRKDLDGEEKLLKFVLL